VEWLADGLNLTLDEIAYIGDAETDLEALNAVGISFAPANADAAVRAQVDHMTEGTVIEGTLEAYRHCCAQNES
jgi:3-deoxy-D-manno-octulosonate 8-phosphate phosphatase KdsC-like HAD superfamily phosphatase